MEIDGALVMEQFLTSMGNLLIIMGFVGVVTLCATGAFVYLVHHRGEDHYGE